MASPVSRIEQIKQLLKQENFPAIREMLDSGTLREKIIEECTKSKVNVDVLCSLISHLYEMIECLQKEFKKKIEKLTEDLEKYKGDYFQLMIGQLGCEVEKAIVNEVLTEFIGPPGDRAVFTIAQMQKALKKKRNFTDIFEDDSALEKAKKEVERSSAEAGMGRPSLQICLAAKG
jgi:hypothetical protein